MLDGIAFRGGLAKI